MAVSSDSILRFHQKIFAKHPILELENGVSRIAVGAGGVSCSTRKLRSKARIGAKAVAEARVKGLESFEVNLDLGLDAVAEKELREKGFSGMRKTKLEGSVWVFTAQKFEGSLPFTIRANYEGFSEGIMVGDELIIDGGMASFQVVERMGNDLRCKCTDPGLLLPRAKLSFWRDGKLPIKINKSIAKVESLESLRKLEEIVEASDGIMVARGDLGVEVPLEQIPAVQEEITRICRHLNKPVIIASQLLESMVEYPTPTRAEVADVSEAVRQSADAMMLSGESAIGSYGEKALSVLRMVSNRMELQCHEENRQNALHQPCLGVSLPDRISEEICNSAVEMANNLGIDAIFVYTKHGEMASLLSRNRPNPPIFAFTDDNDARMALNLQWGVIPILVDLSDDMESNISKTTDLIKSKGMMKDGSSVLIVSDLTPSCATRTAFQSIQARIFPGNRIPGKQFSGEEPPESLFMKELKRRGMTPTSLLEDTNRGSYGVEDEIKLGEEDRGFCKRNAVSTEFGQSLSNQRERSMALNSEGLEGLIPRAKLLLTTGATFFLGFWPLILIIVTFFSALYITLGDLEIGSDYYSGVCFFRDYRHRCILNQDLSGILDRILSMMQARRLRHHMSIDPYELPEDERISQIVPSLK
ncbi:hypothetical protein GH714_030672 [Hevea brasiliensis]|uniref:Pyruvate kinase n=1 Tax=Hevea brasiliensis TaxID=3981 RepID=A0A6A6N886_HEVBR|nr:hypothetical protein GH714_030672 [Hevea brasiliensis]